MGYAEISKVMSVHSEKRSVQKKKERGNEGKKKR